MICNLCGREIPDDAVYCDGCGNSFGPIETVQEQLLSEYAVIEQPAAEVQPDAEEIAAAPECAEESGEQPTGEIIDFRHYTVHSHMAIAVLTTVIFFNWILGIPAIVFARECEHAMEAGQYDIAERFSKRALSFALIGVGINLAIAAFVTLVVVVMRAAGPSIYPYLNY